MGAGIRDHPCEKLYQNRSTSRSTFITLISEDSKVWYEKQLLLNAVINPCQCTSMYPYVNITGNLSGSKSSIKVSPIDVEASGIKNGQAHTETEGSEGYSVTTNNENMR